ncbi:MAG: hypothetical protein Kow0098_04790 [Ignavibacteriaceae bacterium]
MSTAFPYKLIQLLQHCSQDADQRTLNAFVELVFKIALSYTKKQSHKLKRLFPDEFVEAEEIAIDAISSLFIKDENGIFYNIKNSFDTWQPPVSNEEDALYFLNKLVQRRVAQHISLLLRESDPFFSKILDSVNYQIRKNRYKKLTWLGTTYITPDHHVNLSGNLLNVEDLENIPAACFSDSKNYLNELFCYITAQTDFFPAVPLNALVLRLKRLHVNLNIREDSGESAASKFELFTITNTAFKETINKLQLSYVAKGKLTPYEGQIFEKTLGDMLNDLRDGGVNPGLYKYMQVHCPELQMEIYREKYHNILEYLLKILKENIIKHWNFKP